MSMAVSCLYEYPWIWCATNLFHVLHTRMHAPTQTPTQTQTHTHTEFTMNFVKDTVGPPNSDWHMQSLGFSGFSAVKAAANCRNVWYFDSKKIFGWWFPQENPEWCNPAGQASSTKFRFIVYTLIHGLTVQHTTALITATFPLPPPTPTPGRTTVL